MRQTALIALFALTSLAACGTPEELPASADAPIASARAALQTAPGAAFVVQHSGKSLDIEGASQASGARLIQYQRTGGANQRFAVLAGPGGTIALAATHSGLCLTVQDASTQSGAALIQASCAFAPHQLFNFLNPPSGGTLISPVHSGKCLDLSGASMQDAAPVIQWDCSDSPNQRFQRVADAQPSVYYLSPSEGQTLASLGLSTLPATVAALRDAVRSRHQQLDGNSQIDMIRLQSLMNKKNEALNQYDLLVKMCQADPSSPLCPNSVITAKQACDTLDAQIKSQTDQINARNALMQSASDLYSRLLPISGTLAPAQLR